MELWHYAQIHIKKYKFAFDNEKLCFSHYELCINLVIFALLITEYKLNSH